MESWQTCVHCCDGLCPVCQAQFEEDPDSWIQFGDHPAGIANWEALCAEMRAYSPLCSERPDASLPF
jgi:hypothetical protein